MFELILIISQISNSSPGSDDIPNILIKHLPINRLEDLLKYIFIWIMYFQKTGKKL